MKKRGILFKKGVKIQTLNRVAIPKELLENMELKEGDHVALYYVPETGSISLRKDKR